MKTFTFNKKIEEQIEEFKSFLYSQKDINSVKVTFYVSKTTDMKSLAEDNAKIGEFINPDVKFEFDVKINENLKDNERIITVEVN